MRSKTKNESSSIVTEMFGYMEEKNREGRSMRMRKGVLVCDQAVSGNKNFRVQFEDEQKREMGYCFLTSVCYEEEVHHKVNEPISDLFKK